MNDSFWIPHTQYFMFTGIIEATAPILAKTSDMLVIARPKNFTDLKIGSSIAVSGVCLSIVKLDKRSMTFNVIPTTWRKSKLGSLEKGKYVNLERALRADGRFDGHVVQGHCEAVGEVTGIKTGKDLILTISIPKAIRRFLVAQGSVTVDGVSLTISSIRSQEFDISLIPLTVKETTLGKLQIHDPVNIETDILGRYLLQRSA